MKYYAVREGRNPGVYHKWDECKREVIGFKGAVYKKFNSYEEALDFIKNDDSEKIDNGHELTKDDEIKAYVDGSYCTNSKIYSFGMVTISSDGKETFNGCGSNQDMAEMRNVSGELKGAMEAMKIARDRDKKRLYIYYDYAGIEKWAKGEWKTNKKGTKLYKEYYDRMNKRLDIVFIKVKAHSGVKYNEEADGLAKAAIVDLKECKEI